MQQKTTDFRKKFSSGLKYARLARGMTQAELADQLGEKQSVVSNWEGAHNGPGRKLALVAQFFGVQIDPDTGEWKSIAQSHRQDSGMPLLEPAHPYGPRGHSPSPAPAADVAWMLEDFPEASLIEKVGRALRDADVPLAERVRRARVFLAELERRAAAAASSAVDAAAKAGLALGAAAALTPDPIVKLGPKPKAASTTGKTGGPGAGAGPD